MFHCRLAAMDDCETPARLRLQMRSERAPTFTEEALLEHIFACLRARDAQRLAHRRTALPEPRIPAEPQRIRIHFVTSAHNITPPTPIAGMGGVF